MTNLSYSVPAFVLENKKKTKGILSLLPDKYEFNGRAQAMDWEKAYCNIGVRKEGRLSARSYVIICSADSASPEFFMELDQIDRVAAGVAELGRAAADERIAKEERIRQEEKALREQEEEEARKRQEEEKRLQKEAERQKQREEKERWIRERPELIVWATEEAQREREEKKKKQEEEQLKKWKEEQKKREQLEAERKQREAARAALAAQAAEDAAREAAKASADASEILPGADAAGEAHAYAAGKRPGKKSLLKKIWFWIIAAVVAAGIALIVLLS